MRRNILRLDIGLKCLLGALLAYSVVRGDLPQFQDKAMGARAVIYPLVSLIVPAIWYAFLRRRITFPAMIDICVTLPFLFDTAGNAVNLYDSLAWFDDLLHYVNWVPWAAAVGLALTYSHLGRLNVAALTVGYGAVTHILWEIGEYFAFTTKNKGELVGIYRDTIGDLALSLSGSFTAGILVGFVFWNTAKAVQSPIAQQT